MTIRVLHVIDGMGSGGAEAFIMNIYRNIDRKKVQFDFLIRNKEDMYFDEIKALGGRIYIMPSFPREALRNYFETKKFFNEHKEYKIVHVHANALIYMNTLILAKKFKIPVRIMHSHNTKARIPLFRVIHEFNKIFIQELATSNFACSDAAGKWMFKKDNFELINNGIEIKKYLYNENYKNIIREEFNAKDKFIIGHIGRFLKSKNHEFLIDVFKEVYDQNKNAVLMLIGSGPLEEYIREKVDKLGLKDNVIFAGVRSDVNKLLQAFDVFLFPSNFEGLGIALVEAQASGLRCIASDNIPREAKVTNLLEFMSLDKNAKEWANAVLKYRHGYERVNTYEVIKTSGYDIHEVAKRVENFYIHAVSE